MVNVNSHNEKKESAAFTEGSVAFVRNSSGSVAFAEGFISFAKNSNATFAKVSVVFEDDSDTRGSVVLVKESDTSRKEIENEVQINVDDIMERIKFYVTKGNMGSKQIYPLLVASFPDQYIHKRDLHNAIQRFKVPFTIRHGDAQNMINTLLNLKDQEPGWIIHTRIDHFDN
ncbi:8827_t:CDS:2 [Funneliformis caledonium]|uniref:8827_t:CDS:1 n=1 Tax=Funneliformis caledonium TaxID=1117310 RepID=A0A9N9DQN5_9GLOM|nr:8827_t:CDS:2 [Funneliformis caledonium]